MPFVLGELLICFGVLLAALPAKISRGPEVRKWATYELTHELVVVVIVSVFAFGAACLLKFAVRFEEQSFGIIEVGLALAILVVSFLAWPRMRTRREAAAESDPAAPSGMRSASIANGDTTTDSPPPVQPSSRAKRGKGRRAA